MEDVTVDQSGSWEVSQSGSWEVDQSGLWQVGQVGSWNFNQLPVLVHAAMATPTFINPSLIEYCRGEVDKDNNQYGVRVHFVSGNTLWLPGDAGLKFLATIERSFSIKKDETTKRSLVEKFNEKRSS